MHAAIFDQSDGGGGAGGGSNEDESEELYAVVYAVIEC